MKTNRFITSLKKKYSVHRQTDRQTDRKYKLFSLVVSQSDHDGWDHELGGKADQRVGQPNLKQTANSSHAPLINS